MRFQNEKTPSSFRNIALSLIIFMVITGGFYYGITSLSSQAGGKQEQYLHDAIERAVIHCYAVEGVYPESLDYLKENYGISYDTERYFVDYQTLGSNLLPEVTIITLE